MSPAFHPDSSPGSQRAESMASRRIAIVGGGPSGALCAERLASAGFQVNLFDEHLAWEKPCGGGLTHKAVLNYPFLLNGPHPKKMIHQVQLIYGNGDRTHLRLDQPSVIDSRTVMNELPPHRAATDRCRLGQLRRSP